MESLINKTLEALQRNNFETFFAANREEALRIFIGQILPQLNPETVSFGDSETMKATGIMEKLSQYPEINIIRTLGSDMSRTQKHYWRRQALLSDLFITGSNALTTKGQLVNLDMIGNRVGGITFGPKHVVLFIGRNKIVENLDAAFDRIRNYAAPQNIMRHPGFNTPCQKTGKCMDCNSPHRICNTWSIIEKSYPVGRIKIILINEDLGL